MRAKFTFDNVSFFGFAAEVRIGEVFTVELFDTPGPIEWQATNDAVLDIRENTTHTLAIIKATAVGASKIELEYRDHDYGPLRITVVDKQAAKQLKPTLGEAQQQ